MKGYGCYDGTKKVLDYVMLYPYYEKCLYHRSGLANTRWSLGKWTFGSILLSSVHFSLTFFLPPHPFFPYLLPFSPPISPLSYFFSFFVAFLLLLFPFLLFLFLTLPPHHHCFPFLFLPFSLCFCLPAWYNITIRYQRQALDLELSTTRTHSQTLVYNSPSL